MNRITFITLLAVMLTVSSLRGDDASNQYNTSKKSFDNGQYAAAQTGFEAFIRRFPNHTYSTAATFYLAESLLYLEQYSAAENNFGRLAQLDITSTDETGSFARAALFRFAEIPYIQGKFDIAKSRLEEFVDKLRYDSNNQFVLYYLGDIAMRSGASDAAEEAEFYFGSSDRIFPDGKKNVESKLGLAWAKNKLGKVTEADAIYTQLMNSTNPAVNEQVMYQHGTALFDREMFQEAINILTDFQRRYPASASFSDSQRVLVRCYGRLTQYEKALQTIAQIAQPIPDDLLMKVRFLLGLKRTQEAKRTLEEAKSTVAGTTYRDEIALLEAVFVAEQKNWQGTISLLESVLNPLYDSTTSQMKVDYLSRQPVSETKKLSEEGFFRACSLLSQAYANNRQREQANALLAEMQTLAALSGNIRMLSICTDTEKLLADVRFIPNRNNPGRGNGNSGRQYAGGQYSNGLNNRQGFDGQGRGQWTPPVSSGQNSGEGSQPILTRGTDLDKFWRAEQLYRTKNYEAAAQQLEQIFSGHYNQIAAPPIYTIHYNITGEEGTLNEMTFARGCTLLALSKAQLKDFEQANAVLSTLGSRIRMSDSDQTDMLRKTYDQLAILAMETTPQKEEETTASSSLLTDSEQRRLLRYANTHIRKQEFVQADEKLTELIGSNPPESVLTESLFLQGQAKIGQGMEQEGVTILERVIDEFTTAKECSDVLWYLGLYYETGGDSFQAVEYFKMLSEKFPNYKHIDGALYFLAVDDLNNGSGRRAATHLAKIYQNYRNGLYWSHATWILAYDSFKKKQYTQAESYVQEILRHPPDKVIVDRVLYLKGELALRRNDYQSAFLAFREVVQLFPESPLTYHANRNAEITASKTIHVK